MTHRLTSIAKTAITALAAWSTVASADSGNSSPDPVADLVRASGVADFGGQKVKVDLLVEKRLAGVRFHPAGATEPGVLVFTSPKSALIVLADKRLSFLWPAMVDWAGPSLEKFRASRMEYSREEFRTGTTSLPASSQAKGQVRKQTLAMIEHSITAWRLGFRAESRSILRNALDANDRSSDARRNEWSAIATVYGTLLYEANDVPGAKAVFREIEQALSGSSYVINATVNLAAIAAESGNYAEALSLIDNAREASQAPRPKKSKAGALPGSDREFGWIRACALSGLGRTDEARMALAPALTDEEPDPRGFNVKPNTIVRFRAMMCMRDVSGVVQELLGNKNGFGAPLRPDAFIVLQPSYVPPSWYDPATWAQVKADSRIQAAIRDYIRLLPSELEPAVRNWSSSAEPEK